MNKTFLYIITVFFIGGIIGYLANETITKSISSLTEEAKLSEEDGAQIRVNRITLTEKELSIANQAVGGSLASAIKMFDLYTYKYHDYEKSFYWASLSEELGYSSKKPSLTEVAKGNILAEIKDKSIIYPNRPKFEKIDFFLPD